MRKFTCTALHAPRANPEIKLNMHESSAEVVYLLWLIPNLGENILLPAKANVHIHNGCTLAILCVLLQLNA